MDQRATASVGELMEAKAKIAQLIKDNADLKADLKKWKIEFSTDIETATDGSANLVITGQTGDRGARKVIGQTEVLYLMDDLQGLTKYLADEFMSQLIGKAAYDALDAKLGPASANLKLMVTK